MDTPSNLAELHFLSDESITNVLNKNYKDEKFYHKIGQVYLKISSAPNYSIEFKDSFFLNELQKWSKSGSDKSLADKQHIYKFAEELRRFACDGNKSQSLILRGISGSGKSDSVKRILQYLSFIDMGFHPEERIERDLSKPFCTFANPFYVSNDAPVVCKRIAASLSLLELFYTAPTDHNLSSTRVWSHFKVKYGSNGKISGFRVDPIFTELARCNPKDLYCGPLTIQTAVIHGLPTSDLDRFLVPSSLREQYPVPAGTDCVNLLNHVKEALINFGNISPDVWDQVMKVICSIVNLQGITLLGTESAIISSSTKSFIGQAEQLLGLESGTLGPVILKKPDERIGRPAGSVIDCKPLEAKYLIELLSAELIARTVTFLLNELSFNFAISENSSVGADSANNHGLTGSSILHILDPIGWDRNCLNQQSTLAMLLNNYCEEKCNEHFLLKAFQEEFDRYAKEGITIDSVTLPDWNLYLDVFDRSAGGFIQLLDETCANQRSEDKQIADKMILNHNKSKLVKTGGAKTKQTVFVIRHTFCDISYDCDGFLMSNKLGTLPNTLITALKGSKVSFIANDNFIAYKPKEESKDDGKPKSAIKARTEQKGTSPSQYLFHKGKYYLENLLHEFNLVEKTNYLICLNLNPFSKTSEAAPTDYISCQLKNQHLEGLIKLAQNGYSYSRPYHDIYRRFRILIPFSNTNLPLYINETIEKNYKEYCKRLLEECVKQHQLTLPPDPTNPNNPNNWENQVTYGNQAIFMKEKFAIMLESFRFQYYEKSNFSCLLLQSVIRMRKFRKIFLTIKKGSVIFQSYVREKIQRKKFLMLKAAGLLVKSLIIVNYQRNLFLKLKKSVKILKKSFLGKAIQRIRYKRLIKAAKSLHQLAKGFIIRKYSQNIFNCIKLIQRTARNWLHRKRLKELRLKSILKLQYTFRGYVVRKKFSSFIQVLRLRKEQRIAQRVVMKLQSLWRKKLIQQRFEEIIHAVIILQRWIKTRITRKWFLSLKFLVISLQSHFRRQLSTKLVNTMKVNQMVQTEKEHLSNLFLKEIHCLKEKKWWKDCLLLENTDTKKVFRKISELLLTYDLCFDFSFIYGNSNGVGSSDNNSILRNSTSSNDLLLMTSQNQSGDFSSSSTGWLSSIFNFQINLLNKEARTVKLLAMGNHHTILIDDKSNVYSFGLGDLGQLGHGNRKSLLQPKKIEKMKHYLTAGYGSMITSSISPEMKTNILHICCGKDHTIVLTQGGLAYSWGDNRRGQLGHSNFESSAIPKVIVDSDLKPFKNITAISCGLFHSACLTESNMIYTWGAGECLGTSPNYRLGLDDHSNHIYNIPIEKQMEFLKMNDSCIPSPIPYFQKKKMLQLVCGENFTIVIAIDGLYSWGNNNQYGQLGIGNTIPQLIPRKIPKIELTEFDIVHSKLFCGGRHSLFLYRGRVFTWGWNKYGQIGDGTTDNALSPVLIDNAQLTTPASAAALLPSGPSSVTVSPAINKDQRKTLKKTLSSTSNNNTGPLPKKKILITSASLTWRQTIVLTNQSEIFSWGVVNNIFPYTRSMKEMISQEQAKLKNNINNTTSARDLSSPLYYLADDLMLMDGQTTSFEEEPFEIHLKPKFMIFDSTAIQQNSFQVTGLRSSSNFTLSFVTLEVEPLLASNIGNPVNIEDPDFAPSKSSTPSKTSSTQKTGTLNRTLSTSKMTEKELSKTSNALAASSKTMMNTTEKKDVKYTPVINKNTSFTKSVDFRPSSSEVLDRFRQEVGRITLYPGNQRITKKKSQQQMEQQQQSSEESKVTNEAEKSSPKRTGKKSSTDEPSSPTTDDHNRNTSANIGKAENLVELFQPTHLRKMKELKQMKQERLKQLQKEQNDEINLDFAMFTQKKGGAGSGNTQPGGGQSHRSRSSERNKDPQFLHNFLQGTEGIANIHASYNHNKSSHHHNPNALPASMRRLSGSPLSRFITSKAEGPDDPLDQQQQQQLQQQQQFQHNPAAMMLMMNGSPSGKGNRDSFIWSAGSAPPIIPGQNPGPSDVSTPEDLNRNKTIFSQEKARRARLFSPGTSLIPSSTSPETHQQQLQQGDMTSPSISFKEQMHELGYLRKKNAPRFLFSDHSSPLMKTTTVLDPGASSGHSIGSSSIGNMNSPGPTNRKDFKISYTSSTSALASPPPGAGNSRNSLEKLKRELIYMQQKQS